MVSPPITIEESKTIKEAAELMSEKRKGCLIVLRNGSPVGIISDSDIIKRVVAKDALPSKILVKDVMSSPLITIEEDEDVMEAVRKMKKSNISRLPVLRKGELVGVISLKDIAKSSPEMMELLEYRIKMKEMKMNINTETASGICESCGNYSTELKYVNGKWLCESCREDMENEY